MELFSLFLSFIIGISFLVVMGALVWETTKMVDEKKNTHRVSSGEQLSKDKHMDDIL